ncbi:MAG: hypothetical protein QNJ18_13510 [Xenococcaceae cyanobacterium MO_167.B52]|nr:hypothetical protein [Xenococcaceae cyanobacterium MO_167.B52]
MSKEIGFLRLLSSLIGVNLSRVIRSAGSEILPLSVLDSIKSSTNPKVVKQNKLQISYSVIYGDHLADDHTISKAFKNTLRQKKWLIEAIYCSLIPSE